MTSPATKRACVIGWPVSHSRSPLIHNHWLRHYGIDGHYERIEVAPENLGTFLETQLRHHFIGCNITIPHKQAAARFVDVIDDRAKTTGSVNTIYVKNNQRFATSTDGQGFCDNVEATIQGFTFENKHILLIGAGGSARPIVDELLRRGVSHITIANRTIAHAGDLAVLFGNRISAIALADINLQAPLADVLVNTTSLGMKDDGAVPIDLACLPDHAIVADIVYVPLKTALLRHAERRGLRIVSGLGMLLRQAVLGFEYWFGQRPLVTADLYDLVARDIDPDYRR
jgi:shikimate dehydrogenase